MSRHHPREELELPAVLHALSDPHRLQIVRELARSRRAVRRFDLDVTKST